MEIQISRKKLLTWGAVIVLLLIAAIVFFLPSGDTASTPTPVSVKDATPAQIAETVTRLFYIVDYERPSAWLEAMRPYSSEDGAKIMRDVVAPALWPEFTRLKTKSNASQIKVKWNKKLISGHSAQFDSDWEVHLVDVTLDAAMNWPGTTGDSHANVMIEKTAAAGWRFGTFFSDEVTKTLVKANATSAPTLTKQGEGEGYEP